MWEELKQWIVIHYHMRQAEAVNMFFCTTQSQTKSAPLGPVYFNKYYQKKISLNNQ